MTRYRVTGPRAVRGHAPGSVFEAEFDAAKEARLTNGGLIEKVRANTKLVEGEDANGEADAETPEGGDNA